MKRLFNRTFVVYLLLCILAYLAGAVSYSMMNQSVDQAQADAVAQSIMMLAAYESAAAECMDFETRICVVQGKNREYISILEAVYGDE